MRIWVAMHRGVSGIGKAIQWQTRSVYSHAALVFEAADVRFHMPDFWPREGREVPVFGRVVIESREFKGVWARGLNHGRDWSEGIDLFQVEVTPEEWLRVFGFARGQIGKGYDYLMVLRFVSRRQESRRSSGKWFCSELVFAAFQKAGIDLLARTEPWEVSPGMLSRSTRLIYDETI